jgi:hypothetical protein
MSSVNSRLRKLQLRWQQCLMIITSSGLNMQHKSGKFAFYTEKCKYNSVGEQRLCSMYCNLKRQNIAQRCFTKNKQIWYVLRTGDDVHLPTVPEALFCEL